MYMFYIFLVMYCMSICLKVFMYMSYQYVMIWYDMVWYDMNDMLWYAEFMIWYGMVCYVMIWYGTICYVMICYKLELLYHVIFSSHVIMFIVCHTSFVHVTKKKSEKIKICKGVVPPRATEVLRRISRADFRVQMGKFLGPMP